MVAGSIQPGTPSRVESGDLICGATTIKLCMSGDVLACVGWIRVLAHGVCAKGSFQLS